MDKKLVRNVWDGISSLLHDLIKKHVKIMVHKLTCNDYY